MFIDSAGRTRTCDTPEGIDRAFARLDTIKDHAVFWSSGVEPIELVSAYSAAYTVLAKVNAQAAIGEHAFAENLEIYWKEGYTRAWQLMKSAWRNRTPTITGYASGWH